jgi:hypothetical protein
MPIWGFWEFWRAWRDRLPPPRTQRVIRYRLDSIGDCRESAS